MAAQQQQQQQQTPSSGSQKMSLGLPLPSGQGNVPSQPSPTGANGNAVGTGPMTTQVGPLLITVESKYLGSASSIRGLKPGNPNWTNQDSYFMAENFNGGGSGGGGAVSVSSGYHVYCVLDGHGEVGHLVSRRCSDIFLHYLRSCNLEFKRAFLSVQAELQAATDMDVRCSGATCVMVLILNGKLVTCNCGDSRAVLGKRSSSSAPSNTPFVAVPLSNDHKPDRPEERKRIIGCGGRLGCRQMTVNQGKGPVSVPVGPCRVWYQYRGDTLGLAMSRSLGDSIVHGCGVSAEPEVTEHKIDKDVDEFVVIATDGVWDVVDNNQAVQIIQGFAVKSPNWNAQEAALFLTKFARGRWEKLSPMVDDITCVVIKLR